MQNITEIYCAIHLGFARYIRVDKGEPYDILAEDSDERYKNMQKAQEALLDYIISNEQTALIYVPRFANEFLEDFYEYLGIDEKERIEAEFVRMSQLYAKLRDRFVIVSTDKISDEFSKLSENKKGLFGRTKSNVDPYLQSKIHFNFDRSRVNFYAFGEYTSGCVNTYGRIICRSLGVDEKLFGILKESSINNGALFWETYNRTHELYPWKDQVK